MRYSLQFLVFVSLMMVFAACGKSDKADKSALKQKKTALEKLLQEQKELDAKVAKLQAEIAALDPGESAQNAKLVDIDTIRETSFRHYIDLRGKVDAEDISYISPRLGPGQVKAIYVKQGESVRKGQLLLKLDDALIRQQVTAATQQLQGIRTQLAFAKTVYDRQQNLWKQGIGTEVQLINARTNMEALDNQLKAATEQVKVAQEQLNATSVYSDVDGIADVVNVKVGEMFMGATQLGPQIKIVNTSRPKIVINIPENYAAKMKTGAQVQVFIPDINKTFTSTISLISQSIDPVQRGFIVEAKLPRDAALKPNQTAVVKILDYSSDKSLVIPVNAVQSDESGKYVFILEQLGKQLKAKRAMVTLGEVYGDSAEVKSGLRSGQQMVTEGYQSIYEGQQVTIQP